MSQPHKGDTAAMCTCARRMLFEKCAEKAPMIAKVAEKPGWAKLWVHSLDLGWRPFWDYRCLAGQ